MNSCLKFILFASALSHYLLISSSDQSCNAYLFSNHNTYRACSHLGVLNSFLHWNYHQTTGTVEIAYRHASMESAKRWVSWGILMPIGVMTTRYMKVFTDPTWFYTHIICQSAAYTFGIAGAVTGLYLGGKSQGIQFDAHRYIGITLLILGFLQGLNIPILEGWTWYIVIKRRSKETPKDIVTSC
ncbi:hypothetical protein ACOSP7_004190 [Xanthoceras sorbifolium]